MHEIGYIILGWLFGLLSPQIVDSIRLKYRQRNIAQAVATEARDLQYRLAIVSFLIAQRYGTINRSYLSWLEPVLEQYQGNEPSKAVKDLVFFLRDASDDTFAAMIAASRAEADMGLTLKRYSVSFIENHLPDITSFPTGYQSHIHEFRNHFIILNQEIDGALQYQKMTWDSSMTEENHLRLTQELIRRYAGLQDIFKRVCDCLQPLIEHDAKKI